MPDKLGDTKIGDVAATGGSVTGDAGSLDDTAGSSGDTVADEAKASATPKMSPSGPDTEKNADTPSGGLGGVSSVGRS